MPTPAEILDDRLPVVALVGRVNVGKSTLFNAMTEEQKAIVSTIAGTTRTRNEGRVLWRGKEFKLVDTGGLTFDEDVELERDIINQTKLALDEADIIIFVTDGTTGILPQERELAKLLRSYKDKPLFVVANKLDNKRQRSSIALEEWATLGLGKEPFPLSAVSGFHIGDLLDEIYKVLHSGAVRPKKQKDAPEEMIRISLIGKPNAGKSSLFNKLIGEDKVIVSEIAHTTREPHDTLITYDHKMGKQTKKQPILFVDTAGIRRKSKVSGYLEREGIKKSIESVDNSDLVLFVLDGSEPISSQDKQLGGLLEKKSKSVIILINKWDLAEDNSQTQRTEVEKMIFAEFPHLRFAPIHFVSGKTGFRVHQIFPIIMDVWHARQTYIANRALESFLEHVTKRRLPTRGKGTRHPKLLGMRQLHANPPIFELFVKYRTSLHRSYIHYLENRLREEFNFLGTPIVIKLTKTRK